MNLALALLCLIGQDQQQQSEPIGPLDIYAIGLRAAEIVKPAIGATPLPDAFVLAPEESERAEKRWLAEIRRDYIDSVRRMNVLKKQLARAGNEAWRKQIERKFKIEGAAHERLMKEYRVFLWGSDR